MGRPIIQRHPANPLLTADDVPWRCTQVFNAGIARFEGEYVMAFRSDCWDFEAKKEVDSKIGLARSDDGVSWTVESEPMFEMGSKTDPDSEVKRAYDPRLTVVDGRCYMCFAQDTRHGIRGGVAVSDDLRQWEVLSLSVPDNRNMVLFPERIHGRLARLERPFSIYGRGAREAFDIWYGDSPDGGDWGNHHLVLGSEQVPYANSKIGPAAPPIRTDEGWLTTLHAVDKDESIELPAWHPRWHKRYFAGLMLLDLDEPWKVTGLAPAPLLEPDPQFAYEIDGFRGHVIFPGGMIAEADGSVKIYYGAADTYIALATARLEDLLASVEPLD